MRVYFAIPLVIVIFIFSVNAGINMLDADAQDFTAQLQQIEEALKNEKTEEAKDLHEKFTQQWETKYKRWAVFVDHDRLDEINRLLVNIKVDLEQTQSIDDLQHDIAEVIYLFQAIPKIEQITWANIM